MKLSISIRYLTLGALLSQTILPYTSAFAQSVTIPPFVQTHISVAADGGVPFDSTTFSLPTNNAGTDASATNGVVRVTDYIRYKVEVAVNDAASSGDLLATIHLDPTNSISHPRQNWRAVPDNCITGSISADKQTLTCDLGTYREGTNLVFYAEAQATQRNRNGDIVQASVSAKTTDGMSNTATDGPTSVMTTAGFGVDLVKTLKPPYKNTSGDIIYAPDANVDINGNPNGTGYMVTYRITANYNQGSAFVSGDANNKVSYILNDIFSYASGYLDTGALFAGCSVNGANATVVCPAVGTPLFTTSTSTNFPININNIDIANPVDGNKIFSIDVKYWMPNTDAKTDGTPLTNSNRAYFSGGSIVGANSQPISIDNIANPNESTANNGMNYPMFRTAGGGSVSFLKSFWGGEAAGSKNGAKKVVPGEIVTVGFDIRVNREYGNTIYSVCDNIDTSNFQFIDQMNGIHDEVVYYNAPYISQYLEGASLLPNNNAKDGINRQIFGNGGQYTLAPIYSGDVIVEYTNVPHTANTTSTSPQRDSTCEDDLLGNGTYSWTTNPDSLPGGRASVTKIRIKLNYRHDLLIKNYPNSMPFYILWPQFNIKVKSNAVIGTMLPNYAKSEVGSTSSKTNWDDISYVSDNPSDPNYSFNYSYADRVTVVGAKASLQKKLNAPTNIANPGDTLNFTLTPNVGGAYIPANGIIPGPITVTDQLPASNSLVYWTGSCPAGQTITLANPTTNPLVWTISGATVGQPTCVINYNVKLSDNAGKGDYVNTARIDVCDPTSGDDCGIIDKEVDASGNDTIPIMAVAGYSVYAKGTIFDVKKDTPEFYKQVNMPFDFNLSYANLGVEDFGAGSGLDILPYNGDVSMTGTSGPNSARRPGTNYHGSYQLSSLSAANGEYGWQYTTADPKLIINEANNPNTAVTWTNFSPSSVASTPDITAIRWSFPASAVTAGAMRKNIAMTLTPTANWSGDIYTNSFSAKVPEMTFPVISNDVSVQVVAGRIGDTVWYDANANGIIDSGETLLPGIPVTLKNSGGTVIATTVTNANGQYLFTGLQAGTYTVDITKPAAWSYTYDLDSGTGNLSALNGSTAITISTVRDFVTNALQSVTTNLNGDFGLIGPDSTLAGNVYTDADRSKTLNAGDVGLANMIVTLQGTDLWGRSIIMTGITTSTGYYAFTGLKGGVWNVSYTNNTSYIPDSSQTGTVTAVSDGSTRSITQLSSIVLNYGDASINNNFGLIIPASIQGNIYQDTANNDTLDSGTDPLLANMNVILQGTDIQGHAVLLSTGTDSNGHYLFTGLVPGTYTVMYANTNTALTPDSAQLGTLATTAGSVASNQVMSSVVLGQGINAIDYNFGLIQVSFTNTLGGIVYIDNNMNSHLGTGDTVYPGATVTLNGTTATGGNITMTAVTDSMGQYLFTNLPSGTYGVTLSGGSIATGYESIASNAGTITSTTVGQGSTEGGSSNQLISNVSLLNNQDSRNNNFGIIGMDLTVHITCTPEVTNPGGTAVCTINYQNAGQRTATGVNVTANLGTGLNFVGTDPSLTNLTLTAGQTGSFTFTIVTPLTGTYLNQSLPITAVISSMTPEINVLPNIDTDHILIQETNRASLAGRIYLDSTRNNSFDTGENYTSSTINTPITVQLSGTDLYGNVVTRTMTTDSDGNYVFGNLLSGTYSVSIVANTIPSVYESIASNAGMVSGSVDGQGTTNAGTNTLLVSHVTLNAGDNSMNNNFGLLGMDLGVTILCDPASTTPGSSATCTVNYSNLGQRTATGVDVTISLPAGWNRVGSNPSLTGLTLAGNTSGTMTFTIISTVSGAILNTPVPIPVVISSATPEINIIPNTDVDTMMLVDFVKSSIAGTIYHDVNESNYLDTGDHVISTGLTVTLQGTDVYGNLVTGQTTTNLLGYYEFNNLIPGTYTVTLDPTPLIPGYTLQQSNAGTVTGSRDGQGSTEGGIATLISSINVGSGEHSNSNNFGFITPYDLRIMKTVSFQTGIADNIVTYHITYGNQGGSTVKNVIVDDQWPSNYLTFVSSTSPSVPTAVATPTLTGYQWTIGTLTPGQTGEIIVKGQLLSGIASGSTIVNTGYISSTTMRNELNNANNVTNVQAATAGADLAIIKTVKQAFARVGDLVDWVIDYANQGPQTSFGTKVYDFIQSPLSFISSQTTPDVVIPGANAVIVQWNVGTLTAGQTGQLHVTTRIMSGASIGSHLPNVTVINGDTDDEITGNNVSQDKTTVVLSTGSFSGHVFYDPNNDTVQGTAEMNASGIVVQIKDMSGTIIMTLTTNSGGYYMGILPVGNYTTTIIEPANYHLTTSNQTPFTIIQDTDQFVDNDGLVAQLGQFSGHVYYDLNWSQTNEPTEGPGIGVTIQVTSSTGLITTLTTDSNGYFNGTLPVGTYTFTMIPPTGYVITTQGTVSVTIMPAGNQWIYNYGLATPRSTTGGGGGGGQLPTISQPVISTPVSVAPSIPSTPLLQQAVETVTDFIKPVVIPQQTWDMVKDFIGTKGEFIIKQHQSAPLRLPSTGVEN